MLKALSEMQKSPRGGLTIRFLKSGFELSTKAKSPEESMKMVEETLKELAGKL
jgi:hypothetical protein